MTEKRFTLKYINEQHISANLYDNKTFISSISIGEELIVELLNTLSEENEQLKIRFNEEREKSLKFCRNIDTLTIENEKLKHEIEDLNDVLARYEERVLKERTNHNEKDCGHCKHLQIDGMFGMWCEKKHNWTEVKYCKDYER